MASALIPGAADFADLGTGPPALTVVPGKVANAASEAQILASDGAGDAAAIESAMLAATSGLEVPLPAGKLSSQAVATIQSQIQSGQLPGVVLTASNPQVMVAYSKGIGLMDARHLIVNSTLKTDQPATSIAVNPNKDQDSYVAAGDSVVLIRVDATGTTGSVTLDTNQSLRKMPGSVSKVVFDSATKVVQALGRTPDGQNSTVYAIQSWTVYSIESNGNAVFSDARLPFQPVAIGLDSYPQLPDTNREQLLAFSPDGSIAAVDVGQFAFSWRIVGVLFGALMAICLYLLARILFRRRSVGLLVALFSLVDGMLFAQSRIAMNDTYVGGFLLLAYLLFALIWLNVWKGRLAFWLGMPLLGVVLGLALASKWVGLYAIASIGILILIRSALGRVIVILGLAAGTGILGWQAISEMSFQPDTGNPDAVSLLLASGGARGRRWSDPSPRGAHNSGQGLRGPGHGRDRGARARQRPGLFPRLDPERRTQLHVLHHHAGRHDSGRGRQRLSPDRLDARGALLRHRGPDRAGSGGSAAGVRPRPSADGRSGRTARLRRCRRLRDCRRRGGSCGLLAGRPAGLRAAGRSRRVRTIPRRSRSLPPQPPLDG